jgi:L-rhamnose isomerase
VTQVKSFSFPQSNNPPRSTLIPMNYSSARDQYAALGVDTETGLATLASTPISLHCGQGDDVGGFEKEESKRDSGGIQASGNFPCKAILTKRN